MKKEWFLLFASVTVTLLIGLAVIRWFAPQLLGIPVDLQMVQVSEEVSPFFEGVFREEDYKSQEFIIKDPYVKRAVPLLRDAGDAGPHDILGFRNRSIPSVADIVTIGDSQTYGNGARLEQNWPSHLAAGLKEKEPVLYSMAVGGWGAVEYLEILPKALLFKPRVVIMAFYTGNDSIDSFKLAYANSRWADLRPDPGLTKADAPEIVFPAPKSDMWPVKFRDGIETIFTPKLRYGSNKDHPAVRAGNAIMATVARRVCEMSTAAGTRVVFTIIPTKELAFADKVKSEGIAVTDEYADLVKVEKRNLELLKDQFLGLSGAIYVDVLGPLQEAISRGAKLYRLDDNGHPLSEGYYVIAQALAPAVERLLPPKPRGLLMMPDDGTVLLARDGLKWAFAPDSFWENGWKKTDVKVSSYRDVANLPWGGMIENIDPGRFGPQSTP